MVLTGVQRCVVRGAGLLSRSLVNALGTVVPLQGRDLDTITGQTQIGTFGVHEVKPGQVLVDQGGAKQPTFKG